MYAGTPVRVAITDMHVISSDLARVHDRHDVCISNPTVRFVGNGGAGAQSAPGHNRIFPVLFSCPTCQIRYSFIGISKEGPYTGRCSRQDLQSGKRALLADAANALQPMPPPRVSFFFPFFSHSIVLRPLAVVTLSVANALLRAKPRVTPSDYQINPIGTGCARLTA
jgi:hypothetical protein